MKTGTRPEVDTVTIRIPMRLERRGGRKLIIAPTQNWRPSKQVCARIILIHYAAARAPSAAISEASGLTSGPVIRREPRWNVR